MRTAQTILSVIQERGKQKLPLERVYKLLYNRELYLLAYAKLYSNNGAMTKGVTDETVDSMSLKKIDNIIATLRDERYQWTAVKRVYIPKKNGKQRPLGLPTWSDKLLQEVIRMILEAYFEPQFSEHSHGFRPNRGCHTALSEIQTWKGTKWFIEGDISKYFDTIDHDVLMNILGKSFHDGRFLRLINNILKAGYMENWQYNKTMSGTPQGGIVSPILANIYLNEFDTWIEQAMLGKYNIGKRKRANPEYSRMNARIAECYKNGDVETAKKLKLQRREMSSVDTHDDSYRRLRYVRYADDFILGFTGPKSEAEIIKSKIGEFLSDKLKLELSVKKTLITNAGTKAARFLNYEIKVQNANDYIQNGRRTANGVIGLFVPKDVIDEKCAKYMKKGKTIHRGELLQDDDFSIVAKYQSEYRGIVQYYILAQNLCWFSKLHWIMEGSLLKTLAFKHRSTMKKVKAKYQSENVDKRTGKTLKCLKVVVERKDKRPLIAQWGGISLVHQRHAVIEDTPYQVRGGRTELLKRLLADQCELCGSTENIEVHHIRKLADLNVKGRKEKSVWAQIMATRNRKTLVVCQKCHNKIHYGRKS
ncbi:MAG: reverse transcriptase domain-containing protein [Acutalibacteraceae bacterium]|nr:reverse transcriptase domain-containing protein [Acutalibacteraceae bacterium]